MVFDYERRGWQADDAVLRALAAAPDGDARDAVGAGDQRYVRAVGRPSCQGYAGFGGGRRQCAHIQR